jgi:hypothetical protein
MLENEDDGFEITGLGRWKRVEGKGKGDRNGRRATGNRWKKVRKKWRRDEETWRVVSQVMKWRKGEQKGKKPGNEKSGNVRNRKAGRVDRNGGRLETGKDKSWKQEGRKGGQKWVKAGNRKRGKVGNGKGRKETGKEGRWTGR